MIGTKYLACILLAVAILSKIQIYPNDDTFAVSQYFHHRSKFKRAETSRLPLNVDDLTLTPPVTPLQCQCPTDLYSDSLCPTTGPCNRDPGAITYGPPPLCPFAINCEPTDYIRFQYADGLILDNIIVRDFRQLADIQCVNGEWRYYGQAQSDKVLRHIVCYSVAIPVGPTTTNPSSGRRAREAKIQSNCTASCPSLNSYTEINLCPSENNCSAPTVKSLINTDGCKNSIVECPYSSLAVQLKSASSMIVYPQDIHCNKVWIYDDGKHSHEVEGMLCVNKEGRKEKYSKCPSSCPPLKQLCPASDGLDNKRSPNCTSRLDCGMGGNVVVSKRKENSSQVRFRAYAEDTLLFCVNGSWIVNINDTELQLMEDDYIYCKSSNISSLTKS